MTKIFMAFIVAGSFCLVAQVILDTFKLTPGHITSLFTVLGAVLAFFGLYDKLIEVAGSGASMLISNFGNMLFQGSLEGYYNEGIIGFFTGILCKSSAAIASAVVFAFVFTIIFKPKN